MKHTPKSCSCRICRLGKATKAQKTMMKLAERAFRHAAKVALKSGREELVLPAPYGNYTD